MYVNDMVSRRKLRRGGLFAEERNMMELLSPAGSPESVVAAVQNGADAIYLGFGNFNARRGAKNFTEEEFAAAAEYCRIRGVKTYVTLNTLASDKELFEVANAARKASRLGADAILVQDLGVLQAVRQTVPDMPVHASTQMSIHNLEGVKTAAAMGISRVVLARELDLDEIRFICLHSPVEIEVFVHGALCMCYSGQCYMSSVIGRRSGNRGLCAQPCRLPYTANAKGTDYPLSLKDYCLISHLKELEDAGVASLKIEGRMKRPEYAAIVTGIYSRALKDGKTPSARDLADLESAFSRQGFTDGYLTGKTGPEMFGTRMADEGESRTLFSVARKTYLHSEMPLVPVQFQAAVSPGSHVKLTARDDRGNEASAEGPIPEDAVSKALTFAALQTQLYKTGGTPFYCKGVKAEVSPGLSLPVSAINEMRRQTLSGILEKRKMLPERSEGLYVPAPKIINRGDAPVLTVSVENLSQLSPELADVRPFVLYVPLQQVAGGERQLMPFLTNGKTSVCAVLPRIFHDRELDQVLRMLSKAKKMGIKEVLSGNLGQIMMAKRLGFDVRGDYGLNVYNSCALNILSALGLKSATLSFEARLEQIRDISKCIDTELIVYGRLPLMITENCVVKNTQGACSCDHFAGITDRYGFHFPVLKEFGCRNAIYNSKKLFLADKAEDYTGIGLWGVRLSFTTENARECVEVMKRYLNENDFVPNGITRGLYYRGAE